MWRFRHVGSMRGNIVLKYDAYSETLLMALPVMRFYPGNK